MALLSPLPPSPFGEGWGEVGGLGAKGNKEFKKYIKNNYLFLFMLVNTILNYQNTLIYHQLCIYAPKITSIFKLTKPNPFFIKQKKTTRY